MQFSQEIINILDYMGLQFGIVVDWTNENIVPYLQHLFERFIMWQICDSALWVIIMTVLTLVSFKIIQKFYNEDPSLDVLWLFWVVLLLISIVVIICQVSCIVQCITFPEKVLFDYIQCQTSSS